MSKNKHYVGLDQHHKMTRVIVIDEGENVKEDVTIEHLSYEHIRKELTRVIPAGAVVALEATGFWYWLNDMLEDLGYETILVHAKEVAEIAKSKKKSDRKDAQIMAKLAKDGRLHKAYKIPREVRHIRDLLRHRMELVSLRTQCKNQIHSVLHKKGIWHAYSDLFGSRQEVFFKSLNIEGGFKQIVEDQRAIIAEIGQRLQSTEQLMKKLAEEDEIVKLLMTIPGVGQLLSRIIRYEIWDIDRFETFKELQSYVGMAPATYQSAQSMYEGGITREGNRYIRWALVEAAQKIGRNDSYLYWKFHKIKKVKGRNKAKVAVASDLLQAVYFIWKRKQPYRAKPAPNIKMRVIKDVGNEGSGQLVQLAGLK